MRDGPNAENRSPDSDCVPTPHTCITLGTDINCVCGFFFWGGVTNPCPTPTYPTHLLGSSFQVRHSTMHGTMRRHNSTTRRHNAILRQHDAAMRSHNATL